MRDSSKRTLEMIRVTVGSIRSSASASERASTTSAASPIRRSQVAIAISVPAMSTRGLGSMAVTGI